MTYLAKASHIMLDFDPINYRYDGNELYYLSLFFEPYDEKRNFVLYGIKLWIYSNEYKELLTNRGYKIDTSRCKPDYEINKQIVLLTCKYYK